jgi:4a-hydroxytetrahydrobiopterin dehydratase
MPGAIQPTQGDFMKSDLSSKHCQACEGGVDALSPDHARELLQSIPGWKLEKQTILKTFNFENYYETMAFVNAIAWISHRENHHPDLEVGYNKCVVHYSTHAVKGLSENDFICAAKIEALMKL